jgi:diaminopimelate decarboxylase
MSSRRDWNQRLSSAEIAARLERAVAEGLLTAAVPAALFHDLGRLRARFARLAAAFPIEALHAVAIKANPVLGILRALVALGAGLEAASIEEVELARAVGCPAERIVYDSPARTRAELTTALRLGLLVNAGSFGELARIASAKRAERSDAARIGLRINPMVGEGSISATSTAGRASRFGVPCGKNEVARVAAAIAELDFVSTIHVHTGSQGCGLDLLVAAARQALELAERVNQIAGKQRIGTIDIGGGLPAVYRDSDDPPSPEEYAAALRASAPALFDGRIRLVTEFGRALHASCGWAASRVEFVEQRDEQLAVIHLGADFALRVAYAPADWYHDFLVFDAGGRLRSSEERVPTTVAGPLCFEGDVLARGRLLPHLHEGDVLVIRDVGAYTLGMWSHHCSRSLPPVIGYDGDGGFDSLRQRDGTQGVVRFWGGG